MILLKTKDKIRSCYLFLVVLVCCTTNGLSQNGLLFPENLKKDKISFKLVNNLVIIPIEVNGKKLSFLLDTGVNSTILFGVTEVDSLPINDIKPVKIIGLGTGNGVEALISKNNKVRVGKARDSNHTIYVIFDESLNFSARMGIPIHGIIGHDFFLNFIVETNYISKRVTVYKPSCFKKKKCRRCQEFDLSFYNNKPYVNIEISSLLQERKNLKLLIDLGSSDALWLFKEEGFIGSDPKKYFEDYLGLGFSGGIFGKRAKLDEIWLGSFNLKEVKVAFPNKTATNGIKFFSERDGSLGGDILKRFTVTFDYGRKKMILKKNGNYNQPFYYNMSGLTVEHDGMVVVKDIERSIVNSLNPDRANENNGMITIRVDPNFRFFLAPSYIIAEVREDSPAALAGIKKGDQMLKISGKPAYKFKLHEIVSLFSSEVGKTITVDISRNGIESRAKFILKKVI